MSTHSATNTDVRLQRELDSLMRRLSEAARLLPRLTADNASSERLRLIACIERGQRAVPAWRLPRRRVDRSLWRGLGEARALAPTVPAGELYLRRLDELEIDFAILEALGDARRLRPLVARRFGTGGTRVATAQGETTLAGLASAILETVADDSEPRIVPPDTPPGSVGPSLAGTIRALGRAAGLDVKVRVEPRLAAAAAAGDRMVLVADRAFGEREVLRLAVHEVLGHLVSAANGRAQPFRLLEFGTAGSFQDQEGLAVFLEEEAGTLDGRRLRMLAARVLAADCMHDGATFGDTALELVCEHGFEVEQAVVIAERAYRGGGAARDVCYLHGWLRVRHAVAEGRVQLDELRLGRVGLDDVPTLRELGCRGLIRPSVYRPSLSRSLRATEWGTSLETSPPSEVTSLTRLDAT